MEYNFFSFVYRSKVLEYFDHDYLKSKIFSGHQGIRASGHLQGILIT